MLSFWVLPTLYCKFRQTNLKLQQKSVKFQRGGKVAAKTNCVINGIPYYRIRKKIGEDVNGKSIIKPFYGKNKTNAEDLVKEWKDSHKTRIVKDEYFAKTMNYYMNEVFKNDNHADGTKIRYKGVYNRYIKDSEDLNKYRMNQINSHALQTYFNNLKDKVTHSTLIAIRNILTLFFRYAEIQGYCFNPMQVIEINRNKPKSNDIVIFTKEEVKKIITSKTSGQHSYNRFLILFALGTGLRQGELLGLKYSDIKDGQVKVKRQVITDTNKRRKIEDTKTENSVRYVPIPKPILKELEAYKKNKNQDDYIFVSKESNLMDANNLIRSYKRFLISIDVPYKDFHTLRRTYATALCENGVDINTVAKLLGNTVVVAAQYYTFISDKKKVEAVSKIEDLFDVNKWQG